MVVATAISLVTLAASPGLAAPGEGADTAPPDFGNVPPCHVEAIPPGSTAQKTIRCPGPSTELTTLSLSLPDEMSNGIHKVQWRHEGRLLLEATDVALVPETHNVVWTATDASGNIATTTQVILITDTRPPLFKPAPAASVTVEATHPSTEITAALAGITVVDESGSAVRLKSNVGSVDVGKTAKALWTATDDAGNVSRVRQEITVRDTTPPRIEPSAPAPITLEATGELTTIKPSEAGVSGKDAGTANLVPVASPSSLRVGSHTVEWTVRDGVDLVSPKVKQSVTIVPEFALTSSSIGNYAINLVFSQDVDPETVSGITAFKFIGTSSDPRVVDARPYMSVTENTVRLEPAHKIASTRSPGVKFCQEYRFGPYSLPNCYGFGGQWIITLPGSLSSVHGFNLYDGTQPSTETCRSKSGSGGDGIPGCHVATLSASHLAPRY